MSTQTVSLVPEIMLDRYRAASLLRQHGYPVTAEQLTDKHGPPYRVVDGETLHALSDLLCWAEQHSALQGEL